MNLGVRGHDVPSESAELLCQKLCQLGLYEIQLVAHKSFPDFPYGKEAVKKLAETLKHYGIRVAIYGCYVDPLTEAGKARFLEHMEYAKILNAGVIATESGVCLADPNREAEDYCLIKDNIPAFYTLLKETKEALSSTQQQQKKLQKALVEIYYWVFSKTTKLVNQQFFEIAFDSFALTIEQMDKNNAISFDLGQTIIKDIARCAQGGNREDRKLTVLIVDLLFSFLSKETTIRFVSTDANQKRLLFKSLFNIGTNCVENNFEEGLRRVSNAIGWLIIDSIEQMSDSLTIYLIERANELLYISKKMEVTQKTYMFLLTLYTTVGAYCCKEPYYKKYLDCVIKGIRDESMEHIQVAARLRTGENDVWNDLFGGKTKELTIKFVKQVEDAQQKVKGKKKPTA